MLVIRLQYLLVVVIFIINASPSHCNENYYRLPKTVLPENYNLQILSYLSNNNVDAKTQFDFLGNVTIQTRCVDNTKNITLHSNGLEILEKDVRIKDVSSSSPNAVVNVDKIELDTKNEFLIIYVKDELKNNHKYEIFIPFKGELNKGLSGFYRSSYKDKNGEKRWLGITQFEATDARRAFPCFDEPEMKATFDITIGRKDGFKSISNMPLKSTESNKDKDGWYWDKFETSLPMSTYIVAFAVFDFEEKTADQTHSSNNLTFRVWARPNAVDQVDFACNVGPKVLEYFENFFHIKYPLEKMDMVAVPDFSAGAMENWGLVTYREGSLLFDKIKSSKSSQYNIAHIIAHELAHQWFGNLVTMKWWTDLWLNEGFATYMATAAVNHLFPQWNILNAEASNDMLAVFSFDALRTSHPVSVSIGNPSEIDEIFDAISYKKGSSLIRMMSLFLGEDVLRQGVSNYLEKNKYGNAEQDDLWAALSAVAHKTKALDHNTTVKDIMDSWTLQTGYPIINVKRDYDKKSATIVQKRFIMDLENPKDELNPCWWIPLTFARNKDEFNNTVPKYWMSCPHNEKTINDIADDSTWVIFNNEMAGIYKVNYDEKNWQLIMDHLLNDNHEDIPILNKVQLISDAGYLAYVGDLSYDTLFNLLKYLKRENDYVPWKTAIGQLDTLSKRLKRTSVYTNFKKFMKNFLTPIYKRLKGFEIDADKSDRLDWIYFQKLVLSRSCEYDVGDCIAQSKELFAKWQQDPKENPIPNNFNNIIYCYAIEHGNESDWEFLWNQYKNTNIASEKNSMLYALGCSNDSLLLNRLLDSSLNSSSGIRLQDSVHVFNAIGQSDKGFNHSQSFLYNNIEKILKIMKTEPKTVGRYLKTFAARISFDTEEEEFKKFTEQYKKQFSAFQKSVNQALETAKINVQWHKKHFDNMNELFSKLNVDEGKTEVHSHKK